MKIALLGAMPEEIEPILAQLDEYTKEEYANNTYYFANYCGHELIIAYSKIGKVFSTMTAMTMIQKYGAQRLLFSGVAGGINPKLKIGNLIVATKLCQHDLDITAFGHPMGYVPQGSVFIKSDEQLNEVAKSVALNQNIELLEGIIATGDQFVASQEIKEHIVKHFNADAIEMEGASVAVVCDALKVPFFVLRAISDTANMDAGFDFDTFLKSSAKNSADFVLQMIKAL